MKTCKFIAGRSGHKKMAISNEKGQYKRLKTSLDAVDTILQHIMKLDRVTNSVQLDEVLPGLLESMGRYTISDRAYVFEWSSETQEAFCMKHEWCREGVRPTLGEMQDVRADSIPNWMPRFLAGEPIVSYDWDKDAATVPEEYAVFDGQDIHALIVVPVFSNNKLNGYIGLDNPDHKTSEISIRLLSTVGGHLGSLKENLNMLSELEEKQKALTKLVKEQERQKEELKKALDEANLNNEIINSISKIYWLIYRMDLLTDTYEEVSAGQEMHHLTGKTGKISDAFKEARETIVAAEHQELMKEFLDISTLPHRMEGTESIGIEYHAANGSWHLARFIVKKRDAAGRITNVLYVEREINKQKQKELEYQQRLVEVAEEAKRANLAKTDFLRRMSHDIRTPINGIRGIVSIANHFPEDLDRQRECREKVMEASGFLLELVNSVLDMNRLESGAVVLEKKSFDLNDIMDETCSIIEMQAQEYSIPIYKKGWNIKHPYLLGSPLHIKQVLQNIAGNAVKYNREGGHITITCDEISCDGTKAVFKLTCEDTGRGMSEEFKEHAFEPFSQEEFGARTAYMGTGLGLPITKQLVELMDGSIEFESKVDVGTKFTIILPFEIDNNYSEHRKLNDDNQNINLENVKVLLAEDNDLNMEIAEFILKKAGMEVTAARNGMEAVELFNASDEGYFDVILLDVMMPIMNGLDAAKTIRGMERSDAADVPILAMTANAFQEDVAASLEAGMNEHLSKPLDEKVLLRTINRFVREYRG